MVFKVSKVDNIDSRQIETSKCARFNPSGLPQQTAQNSPASYHATTPDKTQLTTYTYISLLFLDFILCSINYQCTMPKTHSFKLVLLGTPFLLVRCNLTKPKLEGLTYGCNR